MCPDLASFRCSALGAFFLDSANQSPGSTSQPFARDLITERNHILRESYMSQCMSASIAGVPRSMVMKPSATTTMPLAGLR